MGRSINIALATLTAGIFNFVSAVPPVAAAETNCGPQCGSIYCGAITMHPKCGGGHHGRSHKHKHKQPDYVPPAPPPYPPYPPPYPPYPYPHDDNGSGGKAPSYRLYFVASSVSEVAPGHESAVCDGNTGNRDTARYVDGVDIDQAVGVTRINEGGRPYGATKAKPFVLTCEDDRTPNHHF